MTRGAPRLAALLLLAAQGCAEPAGKPPAAPVETAAAARPAPAQTLRSNDGTYVVRYAFRPDPIPLDGPFSIDVSVCDGGDASRAARDVDLAIDARMPEHQHGMNTRPVVTPRGEGRFTVDGMLFHMPGRWEIYFDVTRSAVTERAQVALEMD